MITLSDAQKFSEESPSIKKFKPWWEITLDYMILALLLICLLAWARVTSVEASGLICIPRGGKLATYGFVEFRYANSRCSQEFEAKMVLYYPYLLFFQWVIAFLIQRTWLKVPVVITKLDAFHNIFCQMCSIMPTFHRNKQSFRMLPELVYDDEGAGQVKVLHDKLMFLLAEKSYLLRIYRAKVTILLFLSLAFEFGMAFWLWRIYVPKADVACNLTGDKNARLFENLICNFSPAFFLYGVMCVNCVILLLTVIFSCQGLYWTFKQSMFADHTGIFGQMIDHYTGLPGFKDLQFCMSLVHSNARDGNITFEIIKSCLRQDAQLEDQLKETNQSVSTKRARDFEKEHAIVRLIAQELGLDLIDNKQDTNHLFSCLCYIHESVGPVNLDITSNMRERLAIEIQRNPLHFRNMVENDPAQISYDALIDEMQRSDVFGNQYALAAAANIFQARIVVLHCQNTSENREVFDPYSSGLPLTTCFIAFTGPHYYQATYPLKQDGEEREASITARARFSTDEKYRNAVRLSASRQIERSEEGEHKLTKKSVVSYGGRPSDESIQLLNMEHNMEKAYCREIRISRRSAKKDGATGERNAWEYV